MNIFFNLNYAGATLERMVNSCIRKLSGSFKQGINVRFVSHSKMLFSAKTKDKTVSLIHLSEMYNSRYHDFSCNYIDKIERAYSIKKSNK